MVSSAARTVDEYLQSLPPDRRAALSAVRDVINARIPPGFEEAMGYGMMGWQVPLSRYPDTYNGMPLAYAGLAAQKHYNALYLMTVYGHHPTEEWFKAAFAKAGKKLDMGKSCVRWKTLDDLPLDVIGELVSRVTVDEYIARVEAVQGSARKERAASKAAATNAARKPAKPKMKAKAKAPAKPKPKPKAKAKAKKPKATARARRR
jgi:hypothetical protein